MINLDDKQSKGTQWVSVFIDNNLAMYFDSFEVEYIPQQVQNKIKDKSIAHNIVRILDDNYIMSRFYCMAFIKYMLCRKNFVRLY